MEMIARLARVVETLLGTYAEEVAQETAVVQRRRKFTAATLARTMVLGFLSKPDASDEELAQVAGLCGVEVTPQAVEQRFTPRLVEFLERLFRRACKCVFHANKSLAPLLERFSSVFLLDSTTIALPKELATQFPGCGGSFGAGQAAMKLQVLWDLCRGAFHTILLEPGRNCDQKTSLQSLKLPQGSLRISDLGYFDTAVFERISQQLAFWLSRLQFGISVFSSQEKLLNVLEWLAQQRGSVVDETVLLGTERKLACRLVAWRVPEEVANRRRQKLIGTARDKGNRLPSRARLAWCDWMVLVTNVAQENLTPCEMAVLYRARWQIELLFKRWKSLGLVAKLKGSTVARQMAQVWARLLGVLLQQWLLLTSVWGDIRHSLAKASQAIRRHTLLLAASLENTRGLETAIAKLCRAVRVTARQNKRRHPSTFELLNDPSLLKYGLT